MPTLSRIYIKVSLIWLALALGAGAIMTFGGPQFLPVLLPTHVHMFVVGWVTHMIIGVAIWLFPKYSRESPRGHEWLGWAALIGLSLGLVLRSIAEPARVFWPGSMWGPMLVASALLQWAGGMLFVINIWPRIKGKK